MILFDPHNLNNKMGIFQAIIITAFFLNVNSVVNALGSNLTVARDGTAQFRTINEAILAAPSHSFERTYINIKAGEYVETIVIGPDKPKITLIGEGMHNTIVIGKKSNQSGFRTSMTATADIKGLHFVARYITFRNNAGPEGRQAVALRSTVESAFYRCGFEGYQDTLYAALGKQFYRECNIYGTVDFIFGDASAVFQKCQIFVRKPLPNQHNTITAQKRENPSEGSGTVFINCFIKGDPGFSKYMAKTYFGRPWGTYARVVIMKTNIEDIIHPEGWEGWNNAAQLENVYYAEYKNSGPGCATNRRANWTGIKTKITDKEATAFSVRNFIKGGIWIPPTGIPVDLDLL